jgi:hypothetical protein
VQLNAEGQEKRQRAGKGSGGVKGWEEGLDGGGGIDERERD